MKISNVLLKDFPAALEGIPGSTSMTSDEHGRSLVKEFVSYDGVFGPFMNEHGVWEGK